MHWRYCATIISTKRARRRRRSEVSKSIISISSESSSPVPTGMSMKGRRSSSHRWNPFWKRSLPCVTIMNTTGLSVSGNCSRRPLWRPIWKSRAGKPNSWTSGNASKRTSITGMRMSIRNCRSSYAGKFLRSRILLHTLPRALSPAPPPTRPPRWAGKVRIIRRLCWRICWMPKT